MLGSFVQHHHDGHVQHSPQQLGANSFIEPLEAVGHVDFEEDHQQSSATLLALHVHLESRVGVGGHGGYELREGACHEVHGVRLSGVW